MSIQTQAKDKRLLGALVNKDLTYIFGEKEIEEQEADNPTNFQPIYRKSYESAYGHGESNAYVADRNLNAECCNAINTAINESRYDTHYYKMEDAAKQVVDEYGSERVELIMAKIVAGADWDGRYSRQNKDWAKGFEIPSTMKDIYSNTHPILLEGFLNKVRENSLSSKR